jgi:hypothetical protein
MPVAQRGPWVSGIVVAGHGVASGAAKRNEFPGGTRGIGADVEIAVAEAQATIR